MKEVYINMNPNDFSGKLFHNRIYRIKNCGRI